MQKAARRTASLPPHACPRRDALRRGNAAAARACGSCPALRPPFPTRWLASPQAENGQGGACRSRTLWKTRRFPRPQSNSQQSPIWKSTKRRIRGCKTERCASLLHPHPPRSRAPRSHPPRMLLLQPRAATTDRAAAVLAAANALPRHLCRGWIQPHVGKQGFG